ncbi:hypothetical protein [Winogradskyella ursingii]|uniref:hypothetical protein n=1 Tax=Winogradskyella ursingii TaxID=2686079 RepID=UPI0015C7CAE2|nr:hypothetical protein [Winogradskyella ursingii]
MMKPTEYYIKARLFPTIICAVPLWTLYYFGFSEKIIDFIEFLKGYKWVSDITISIAIIYFMTQINRFIAKEIFQNIFFKEEKNMPTTNFLLYSNTFFAQSTKKRIREKIKERFGIELLNASQENEDELEARKTIVDAVAQVRNVTRDNRLLLQHNIEYGFTRNLIGGCLIAVLVTVFNLYFFKTIATNVQAVNISIIVGTLYLIPILLSKYLVNRYGKNYAKVLFEQFLNV